MKIKNVLILTLMCVIGGIVGSFITAVALTNIDDEGIPYGMVYYEFGTAAVKAYGTDDGYMVVSCFQALDWQDTDCRVKVYPNEDF